MDEKSEGEGSSDQARFSKGMQWSFPDKVLELMGFGVKW